MKAGKRVIALGFFDGIHLGHAELLHTAKNMAYEANAVPAMLTFDRPPEAVISGHTVQMIQSVEDRKVILKEYFGIDQMIVLNFDKHTMQMDWSDFIEYITEEYDAVGFVAGHDFRFGYRGEGTAEKLREKCARDKIWCQIVPPVMKDGIRVSSTYIRKLIAEGEMERAVDFLGHPYLITDTVHSGYKIGRRIGTPTVNMNLQEGILAPARGVYASKVHIEGEEEKHISVTNIGVNPTIRDGGRVTVETHILDYGEDIYGKRIELELYKYLRGECRFSNVEELQKQIAEDIENSRNYFFNL